MQLIVRRGPYAHMVVSRNPVVLATWLFDIVTELAAAGGDGLGDLQLSAYATPGAGETEEALARWQNWTLSVDAAVHREFTERLASLLDWVRETTGRPGG